MQQQHPSIFAPHAQHQQKQQQPRGISASARSGAQPAVSVATSTSAATLGGTMAFDAAAAAAAQAKAASATMPATQTPSSSTPPHLPRVKALLVDAAGTLLVPSEPVTEVYLRYARQHGLPGADDLTPESVLANFRRAYNLPWSATPLRYVGDGRAFWRRVVALSVGHDDSAPRPGCRAFDRVFDDVYDYYAEGRAWRLAPGAVAALTRLRAAGVRVAVCSNFDTRLRPILSALGVDALFDACVVSAEVGAEKPSPLIFEAAVRALGVSAAECVHVGDDRRNDVWGGRDAGVTAWLWGSDVHSFDDVARRVLHMSERGLMAFDEDDD